MHAPPVPTATTTTAAAAPSARSYSSSAAAAAAALDYDSEDDEALGLLGGDEEADDLSIEAYMRRHPCILDRGGAFLQRHAWLHQVAVLVATVSGVAAGFVAMLEMECGAVHKSLALAGAVLTLSLFGLACLRAPGVPPRCPDESSVIGLLHAWPASSHHYGLHASEWSRSWSFCTPCANWRPARTHHCSTCNTCVLLMDHRTHSHCTTLHATTLLRLHCALAIDTCCASSDSL